MVTAPIDFEARFTKAIENLEGFMDKVDKRTKKGADSLKLLETAGKAIFAAFSFNKIVQGFESLVEKASEAEESTLKLSLALRATGDSTENNVKMFRALAKELEETSKYDDDLILSNIALAKQFGVTNREAEELIRTAVDLSAITGDDLATSVRQLGQTLDGTAGKMAQQFPILQTLTAAQLRHGAAIRVLGDQYRGAAKAGLETVAGQTSQLSKNFNNLQEALGNLIIKNPQFLKALNDIVITMANLVNIIENGSSKVAKFFAILTAPNLGQFGRITSAILTIFKNLTNAMATGGEVVDLFNGKMNNLTKTFNPVTGKFEDLKGSAAAASRSIKDVGESFNSVTGRISKGFDESGKVFDRFANETREKFEALEKQLEDVGRTELDTLTNLYNKNRQLINKAADYSFITRKQQTELLGKLELKYAREAFELRRKQYQELEARVREAYDNPFNAIGDRYNPGVLSPQGQTNVGAVAGFGRNLLQGAEGARNVIGAGVGAIASIWLGPAGQVVGELVKELSRGPQFVREMMTQFFDAIPDLVVNLIAAVQEAIIVFADKAPEALEKLLERTPEIIDTLIANFPKILTALPRYILMFVVGVTRGVAKAFQGIGRMINRYFNDLVRGAGKFIDAIVKGAGRFVNEIVKGIQNALKKVSTGNGLFGGSGGGLGGLLSGAVGGVGGAVTSIVTGGGGGIKIGGKRILKGGATDGGSQQPLVVNLQISNKNLASAIVDLQKLGFNLA